MPYWDKESVARFRRQKRSFLRQARHFVFRTDPKLGRYLFCTAKNDADPYCIRYVDDGYELRPLWITARSFRRRQKLGLPGPRKKPVRLMMREMDFGLEEIERAMEIIDG